MSLLRAGPVFTFWMCALLWGVAAQVATASTTQMCDRAAYRAAQHTGVPLSVLQAITRTETGRAQAGRLTPWPWTVNMEGKGRWFETQTDALAYVSKNFKRGARSFDVGCFQINYRWHGQAFNSIEEMFDPDINARYAADFLRNLHSEFGSWTKAAGAFHSRTPKFAKRYIARYQKIHAQLDVDIAAPPQPPRVTPQPRNTDALAWTARPILPKSGATQRLGSLMPLPEKRSAQPLFTILSGS